jgi:hypothetical protein
MKRFLPLLFLASCASQSVKTPFSPPATAASHDELLKAIPRELFRGDMAGDQRATEDARFQFLDLVFLKNEPDDKVPMRIAVYKRENNVLHLLFVTPTPFAAGDCKHDECRARISMMPMGFQISRESFGAGGLKTDYRFVLDGNDYLLTGKGFQCRHPGGEESKQEDLKAKRECSLFYDYAGKHIHWRTGGPIHSDPLPETKPQHLLADKLRFEELSPENLCTPPAESKP